MTILKLITIGAVLLLVTMPLLSCSDKNRTKLGVTNSELAPCPSSPNCVSSDDHGNSHKIHPFQLNVLPAEAWKLTRKLVLEMPRTQIVQETSDYLHAECQSALFGFIDDLELHLRPTERIIAIRSASRMGYSDFGVNRRRVEALRNSLISQGVLRQ
ncbi:MAG: DUF1499 domain-containing protein [Pseudomonadota bacterium]|nr:DUF1499 domain-containing protein [Pseudomonadota bacterium]